MRQRRTDGRKDRLQVGHRHAVAGKRQLDGRRRRARTEAAEQARRRAADTHVAPVHHALVRGQIVIGGVLDLHRSRGRRRAGNQLQPVAAQRPRCGDSGTIRRHPEMEVEDARQAGARIDEATPHDVHARGVERRVEGRRAEACRSERTGVAAGLQHASSRCSGADSELETTGR